MAESRRQGRGRKGTWQGPESPEPERVRRLTPVVTRRGSRAAGHGEDAPWSWTRCQSGSLPTAGVEGCSLARLPGQPGLEKVLEASGAEGSVAVGALGGKGAISVVAGLGELPVSLPCGPQGSRSLSAGEWPLAEERPHQARQTGDPPPTGMQPCSGWEPVRVWARRLPVVAWPLPGPPGPLSSLQGLPVLCLPQPLLLLSGPGGPAWGHLSEKPSLGPLVLKAHMGQHRYLGPPRLHPKCEDKTS